MHVETACVGVELSDHEVSAFPPIGGGIGIAVSLRWVIDSFQKTFVRELGIRNSRSCDLYVISVSEACIRLEH